MKKLSLLILVLTLLLSSCGIAHTSITETSVAESESEPSSSEVSQTTHQSGVETTPTPSETSAETTGTTTSVPIVEPTPEQEYLIMLKRDVLVLMIAYPDHVAGVEMNDDNAYLVMTSGKRILYDDKREKTFDEKMTDADIQDMLETLYPLSEINDLLDTNIDPGRARAYSLINEIYGSTEDVITKKLITVDFGKQRLPFNKEAGAAAALTVVAAGAADLVKDQPQIADFLYPSSGTFNYRVIAGTNRLSAHAYGIAIDLKSSPDGYWRWASPEEGEKLLKSYPKDLVRLFEKNGFIWGGKWNHFDLFHFEYRPEIIIKATYFSGKFDVTKPWYQGADLSSDLVKQIISQIDGSLD